MKTLYDATLNQTAIVKSIEYSCALRRRFLDLGLISETEITPIFSSVLGDPRAYLVRGSVIAIRAEDAKKILIF
ncbi:MAG: ferrous iron transport protein A [Clostridia bacterium]|nr:ferrous iron transport protein A [Clostridia bacterium]